MLLALDNLKFFRPLVCRVIDAWNPVMAVPSLLELWR
jgi:hypothetical protein